SRNRQVAIHPSGGELWVNRLARPQEAPGRAVVLAVAGGGIRSNNHGCGRRAQSREFVFDPLSRWSVVLSRRGDGAKRRARRRCWALDRLSLVRRRPAPGTSRNRQV